MYYCRWFNHSRYRTPVLFSQVGKAWFRTVGPTGTIIDLNVVKQHCRVPLDLTEDDALFGIYLAECEKYVEDRAEMAFRSQTWELSLEGLPDPDRDTGLFLLRLERPPVTAVNTVKYYDENNVLQTLSTDYWKLEANYLPPRLNLQLWNANITLPEEPVRKTQWIINFTCGSGVTDQAKAAILSLVGHRYKNREAVGSLNTSTVLPRGIDDQIESLKWRP